MRGGLVVILYIVLSILLCEVLAGPEDFLSQDDNKALIEKVIPKFDTTTGSVNKQLKDTFFAVDALKRLGVRIPTASATCTYAKEEVGDNIESVFYSVSIREALGCGEAVSGKVLNTITSALSSQTLLDLVHVVGVYTVLKANKHIDIPASKLEPISERLLDLIDSEYGTWLGDKNQEEGSPYYAGLALTALSQLSRITSDVDINSAVEAALVLLDNGIDDDETYLFFRHIDNSVNSLKTTAFVAKGLADLQSREKSEINEQINLIAGFLVSQKYVSTVEDVYSLLVGLDSVNSKDFKRPLVLSLVNTQIYATKEKDRETNVLVKISDVYGQFTIPVKVILVRAFRSGKEEISLLSNQEISPQSTSTEKNIYSLDFLAARPDPGTYTLEFRVVPLEKTDQFQSITSTTRRLQVVAAIGLSEGQLDIFEQGRSVSSQSFQQLQTVKPASIKGSQSLSISFKLKNLVNSRTVQAHQVFLKLTHSGVTKQSKYFVIDNSGQTYDIKLTNSKIGEKFNYINGTYDVELLIGDSFVSSSFRWVVAKIDFIFEGNKPIVSDVQDIHQKLPEIKHIFRPDAKLAPEILTLLFSGLVVLPFIIFIISVFRVGTLTIPTGFIFIYAALFVGGVGTLLALILFYWFGLKLFTALTYGVIIGVPTIYCGKDVLKYNAQQRRTNNKKQQ